MTTLDADVLVIGLGSIGSMAAWRLAQNPSLKVIGLEQYGPAHARGAYAGESRLFRMAYHEGPDYVPLLLRTRELWHELEAATNRTILLNTGTLSIGSPDFEGIKNTLESVQRYNLEHEVLSTDQLHRRYPQHRALPDEIGIIDSWGGGLKPEVAVLSAIEQATAQGAELRFHTPVTSLEQRDDHVVAHTPTGPVTAGRAVVTTGPWTGELLGEHLPPIHVRPVLLTWFQPHDIAQYQPEVFPAFIRDSLGIHLFGAPTLDNIGVKVSVLDVWGDVPTVAAVPRWFEDEQVQKVTDQVTQLFPGLTPEPSRWSVHVDGFTDDDSAIIGPLASNDRIVVATAGSGHGFKLAPVFGQIAADIATAGGTSFEITRFTPERAGASLA